MDPHDACSQAGFWVDPFDPSARTWTEVLAAGGELHPHEEKKYIWAEAFRQYRYKLAYQDKLQVPSVRAFLFGLLTFKHGGHTFVWGQLHLIPNQHTVNISLLLHQHTSTSA